MAHRTGGPVSEAESGDWKIGLKYWKDKDSKLRKGGVMCRDKVKLI